MILCKRYVVINMELQAPLTILSIVSIIILFYINIIKSSQIRQLHQDNKKLYDLAHYTNQDLINLEQQERENTRER